jgi:hypothetical protein
MQVIAGDVGGTKTLLARCEVSGASVRVLHAERVESRGYARFEDLLRAVAPRLGAHTAEAVCLGVAGPVDDDRCRATNLPWTLDARAFVFRKIAFPRLVARDPRQLLPGWAKKDPKAFAKAEPALWKLIESTLRLAPQAKPRYATKRRFLLKQAQMEFFLSKAMPKARSRADDAPLPPGHPPLSH